MKYTSLLNTDDMNLIVDFTILLFKWKKQSDPTCPLCNDKPLILEHILSSCKTALGNGRYTWRHNRVLENFAKFIKSYMISEPIILTQRFVLKRGRIYAASKQTIKHRAVLNQNLGSNWDWKVSADLTWWYNNYSKTISSKGLRPEIVLLSRVKIKSSW